MTSQPYDELNKRHEELAEQARAEDAGKLKSVPEKEIPASGARFGELKSAEKTVADEMLREKNKQQALTAFPEVSRTATEVVFDERASSSVAPMRVHADRDHEGVFPKPKTQDVHAPAKHGGTLQPTPGGIVHQPGRPPNAVWDRPHAVAGTEGQQPAVKREAKRDGVWDRAPAGEMTDGKQASQSRETTREVTDSRQRNPFDREASDEAQRLVNTIAARDRDGRGRA